MRRLSIFLSIGLVIGMVFEGMATIIDVPGDSATIQDGINGASAGDTIPVACGTEESPDQVSFISTTEDWSVGDGGIVRHIRDGGLNWLPQESSIAFDLYSVDFITGKDGSAVGDGGTILKYSCTDEYRYFDDFSTDKAITDSYFHSLFYDIPPDISLGGFLSYINMEGGRTLGFFRGFMVDAYAYLDYRFPLDGGSDPLIGGTIELDVWVVGYNGHLCLYESYDEVEWEPLGYITLPGHYDYTLSPQSGCSSVFLRFSGGGVLIDNLSLLLPLNSGSEPPLGLNSAYPTDFALSQNHPNPFNAITTIKYVLLRACDVKLAIYNIVGQKVATLVDGNQKAGYKTVRWDASSFSSGIYFYRLKAGNFVQTRKMILLK